MNMSIPVTISWEQAGAEAIYGNFEHIEPEHMFAGLTKLQDYLEVTVSGDELDPDYVETIRAEMRVLILTLEGMGINVRTARRTLRASMGTGGVPFQKGQTMHRSDAVRDAFTRAFTLAEDNGEKGLGVHRLMQAILDIPGTKIEFVLQMYDVTREDLQTQVAQLNIVPALPVNMPSGPVTDIQGQPIQQNRDPGDLSAAKRTGENKLPVLQQFGMNLTQLAREGELGDAFERETEIMQVLEVLSQTRKSNPMLIGEPGVGKTAIVEGLAYRIAHKHPTIPPHFHDIEIIKIDLPGVIGGTQYRGAFEERLNEIIKTAKNDPNVILFIDEIHMLIGAGATGGGAMDGANILKQELAGRQLAVIGATTIVEFNRFIERDQAIKRRFVEVRVGQPSAAVTIQILTKGIPHLQESHDNAIQIEIETVETAVRLSERYMPDRQFPDKAFEVLDRACARARMEGHLQGVDSDRTADGRILILPKHVERVVLGDTEEEKNTDLRVVLQGLKSRLESEIVGQEDAVNEVVRAMQSNYLMSSKGRPIGVFLFVGPTGVGKTQLVRSLANAVFGGYEGLIQIDMSEYTEEHSISRLIGSPPGYVGHEEGGQLTEALRMKPRSVVLLDEIEKAHRKIANIFLQVFNDGRLTDGRGRTVSASDAIFVMTSNLGYQFAVGDAPMPSRDEVIADVEMHFRPELLNRIDQIIQFSPLRREHMLSVVDIHFGAFKRSMFENHQISLELEQDAREWLAEKGYDMHRGARPLLRLIDRAIKQPLGERLIDGRIAQGSNLNIMVNLDHDDSRDNVDDAFDFVDIDSSTLPPRSG